MNREAFHAELEALGVAEVRHRVVVNNFSEHHLPVAKLWLERKDHEAESARSDANIELTREANALASKANDLAASATAAAEDSAASARRSADAADESNRLARKSNRSAVGALIAAIIAATAAVISVIVQFVK